MAEPSASNFPSSLDDSSSLGADVVNLLQYTLDGDINASVTTVTVAEADLDDINVPCYLLIDNELIWAEAKSGQDFTSCVRGADGTTAAGHTSGATIGATYAANIANQHKNAIIAIQTELGTDPDDHAHTGSDFGAQVDHGNLGGLTDDDHTQYIKDSEFTQDSGILVGTGSGTFQEETGSTLRTSIGLSQAHTHRIRGTVVDPATVYGVDTQIVLFRTDAAITITRIHISGPDSSPTTELDIDLKWADDTTAWTNAAVIDVCDTTSGVVTITSGFDDATVASGKYVYWQFGAEPHADWTSFWFEIYYTYD